VKSLMGCELLEDSIQLCDDDDDDDDDGDTQT
jgi:hypothetical protein